ncbi:MAG: DUF2721 domain-containing protein [Desulfatiglandales bacterium]
MTSTSFQDIVILLQTAISPGIIISAVGLLLLSMTNRLGRVIDRQRLLCAQSRSCHNNHHDYLMTELSILWKRARIIRYAITFSSLSALFASFIIILLFIIPLTGVSLTLLVVAFFVFCLLCLILSLLLFILDVNHSLSALKIEILEAEPDQGHSRTGLSPGDRMPPKDKKRAKG